ncbi:MAG: FtsW/RodA/SpoVE family cell cycle protein [Actinomycetota bacterium]|nr:FtsW/RodA/SpoVE family cell cycle protein [Actinomycetota bacterium]
MRGLRPRPDGPALRLVGGDEAASPGSGAGGRLAALFTRHPGPTDLEAACRRDGARLTALAVSLTCFGTVMVLFASPVSSIAVYGSPFSLFEHQLLWVVLGLVAYAVARRIPMRRVRQLARPALVVAVVLLLAVLVPHLGKVAGGSSRWIGAGPFRLQPSELSKLAFAMFCADLVARRRHARDQLREVIRPLAIVLVFACVLILKQPDLGTAIVVVCVALGVLYVGGIERRLLAGFAAVLAVGGTVLALSASYRRARLLSFVNPFGHATTTGYQVVQSLVSLGSGHLTGVHATAAIAPWFLPNADTDFIFAVIGNDFGLIGGIAVVAAFVAFGLLVVRIAMRTSDPFARLLVSAIACWIVLQAIINIGGVIGALPETGIPLPFLSYGGSSLIVVLFATGLVVNVARAPRQSTEAARPARPARTAHPARPVATTHPARAATGRPVRPTRPAPPSRRAATGARPSTAAGNGSGGTGAGGAVHPSRRPVAAGSGPIGRARRAGAGGR